MLTWRASLTPSASRQAAIAVTGGLEHDRVEAAVEAEERERDGRGLARPLTVGGEPHAVQAQRGEQGGGGRVAAQVHAGVVVVEAAELEPPRADLLAGPGLERRDGGLARGDGGDVELADRGEAAREVLERRGPDRVAAGGERALTEHDGSAHASRSCTRVRPAVSAASPMPIAVDARRRPASPCGRARTTGAIRR